MYPRSCRRLSLLKNSNHEACRIDAEFVSNLFRLDRIVTRNIDLLSVHCVEQSTFHSDTV
jgi:hypothetical protein